jgi:hypothetical protein
MRAAQISLWPAAAPALSHSGPGFTSRPAANSQELLLGGAVSGFTCRRAHNLWSEQMLRSRCSAQSRRVSSLFWHANALGMQGECVRIARGTSHVGAELVLKRLSCAPNARSLKIAGMRRSVRPTHNSAPRSQSRNAVRQFRRPNLPSQRRGLGATSWPGARNRHRRRWIGVVPRYQALPGNALPSRLRLVM